MNLPDINVLNQLGQPTAILADELFMEGYYVHEYLYCDRGLVLSVAESLSKAKRLRIVRSRGIPVLDSPKDFGPNYYRSFEDDTVW